LSFGSSLGSNKLSYTRAQIIQLEKALDNLRLDIDRYPSTNEGLGLLVASPEESDDNWNGPYLKKSVPNDPWKNNYMYYYPARYGSGEFDLYSLGKNGIDDKGKEDDITNWGEVNEEYYGSLSLRERIYVKVAVLLAWLTFSYALIRFRRPTLPQLPERFAMASIIIMIAVIFWGSSLTIDGESRMQLVVGALVLVLLFGNSILGTALSIASITRHGISIKSFLLMTINASPLLIVGGLFLIA